jgi:chromosome segregation ATPase
MKTLKPLLLLLSLAAVSRETNAGTPSYSSPSGNSQPSSTAGGGDQEAAVAAAEAKSREDTNAAVVELRSCLEFLPPADQQEVQSLIALLNDLLDVSASTADGSRRKRQILVTCNSIKAQIEAVLRRVRIHEAAIQRLDAIIDKLQPRVDRFENLIARAPNELSESRLRRAAAALTRSYSSNVAQREAKYAAVAELRDTIARMKISYLAHLCNPFLIKWF